jgi:hypothetical protein
MSSLSSHSNSESNSLTSSYSSSYSNSNVYYLDRNLSSSASSFSSPDSFIENKQIVNNLETFLKSKENEFALDSYPGDCDDNFGIDSSWSHVEKLYSNIYYVSSSSEYLSINNDILSRVDTGM